MFNGREITEDEVLAAVDWFVWRTLPEVTDLVGQKRSVQEDEHLVTDEKVRKVLEVLILKDLVEKQKNNQGELMVVEYKRKRTQPNLSPVIASSVPQRLAA